MIVYLILYILNLILFIISIILSIYYGINYGNNSSIYVIFVLISCLSLMFTCLFMVLNYEKYSGKALGEFPRKRFETSLKHLGQDNKKIDLIYENFGYRLKIGDFEYKFDLKTCGYKKSFIIAFIIRILRRDTVSEKLPLYNLYRKTLKIKMFNNITICFEKNNKKNEYSIVKNGISKYSFLAQIMTFLEIPFKHKHFEGGHSIFETIRLD